MNIDDKDTIVLRKKIDGSLKKIIPDPRKMLANTLKMQLILIHDSLMLGLELDKNQINILKLITEKIDLLENAGLDNKKQKLIINFIEKDRDEYERDEEEN